MNKELEIYIHIPFCVKKCRYCDFLSGPANTETKDSYMAALCSEITGKSSDYDKYQVTSIFFGGGTPTCVKPEWIEKIMLLLKKYFHLNVDAEVTMEMNPGTVDMHALEIYHEAGINRLSIGLQSVISRELTCLGRIHSYDQFLQAYFTAREIGFSNINVDVMSGLPEQSLKDYLKTLRAVTQLDPPPEHISAYSLIVEEGTPFYQAYEHGELHLPDEETDRAMYEATRTFLQRMGYDRYEISNYAKKGYECRHNIGYWQRKNYVGFGIGAASLIENVRFRNDNDLDMYIQNPCNCMTDIQCLSVSEQMEETMFLGLRMTRGVSFRGFEKTFGIGLEQVYGEVIRKHVRDGLLKIYTEESDEEQVSELNMDHICLTLKGMDVSNYVMADFLEP